MIIGCTGAAELSGGSNVILMFNAILKFHKPLFLSLLVSMHMSASVMNNIFPLYTGTYKLHHERILYEKGVLVMLPWSPQGADRVVNVPHMPNWLCSSDPSKTALSGLELPGWQRDFCLKENMSILHSDIIFNGRYMISWVFLCNNGKGFKIFVKESIMERQSGVEKRRAMPS